MFSRVTHRVSHFIFTILSSFLYFSSIFFVVFQHMAGSNLFVTVLSIPLLLFTVFGNFLVIIVIRKCKKILNANTHLIFHLAWSDLFFALTTFAETILVSLEVPYSSFQFLFNALFSSYILVVLAIERYYAILKPFVHMKKVDVCLTRKVCTALWVLVGVLTATGFVIESFENRYKYSGFVNGSMDTSRDLPPVLETINITFVFVVFVLGLVIPSTVMILCYSHVIYHVWFSAEDKATNAALFKSRRKLTKLFIIVTMIFIITWTPTYGRLIVKEFVNHETTKKSYQLVSMLFALIGSAANPAIYSFRCPRFRQEAVKTLSCCCCKMRRRRPKGRSGNRVFVTSGRCMTETQHNTTNLNETYADSV